jgi:hypothetical protein
MVTGLNLWGKRRIAMIGEDTETTIIRMNPTDNRCVDKNNDLDGNCALLWDLGGSFLTFSRMTFDGNNVGE